MSLFQKSVEKKYLSDLDSGQVDKKFAEFQEYFGNPSRQEYIRNSKEEQFQEGFLRELFVKILGYTISSGRKDLLALLNSKLVFYYLRNNCSTLQGGYYDFRRPYIEKIPIHKSLLINNNNLITLAELALKKIPYLLKRPTLLLKLLSQNLV